VLRFQKKKVFIY